MKLFINNRVFARGLPTAGTGAGVLEYDDIHPDFLGDRGYIHVFEDLFHTRMFLFVIDFDGYFS